MADDLPPELTAFLNDPDPSASLAAFDASQSDPAGFNVGGPTGITVGLSPAGNKALIRRGIGLVAAAVHLLPPTLLTSTITAIATLVGSDPSTLLTGFLKKKGRGRRTRGISGRQLQIARSTIGKVERMHRSLSQAFGRATSGHRRAPAAPPFRVMHGGRK